jgi:hypothetical protein
MTEVIELEKAKLDMAVRRGYRNWKSQFQEDFGPDTRLSDISTKTLALLAHGKDWTLSKRWQSWTSICFSWTESDLNS